MSIGESVGQISVLELPTMNDPKPHIEVLVVDVFTPSFFWIQLRKNKKTFDKLMNDINAFYIANEESYKIPLIVLEKGLNCACKYGNVWHRAIIKNVGHDYKVTLMFYDYGTIKTYEASEVCYLHRQFSYIPAQAIPASLINIKPCNGTVWSRGVTHEFAERVSHAPLIATIAKVDEESNSALITLTDTTEEDDVHINDWLVEQKFAVYGKMSTNIDKVNMSDLLLYTEENLLYYPERCYAKDEPTDPKSEQHTHVVQPKNSTKEFSNSFLKTSVDTEIKPPPGISSRIDSSDLLRILKEDEYYSRFTEPNVNNTSNTTAYTIHNNPLSYNNLINNGNMNIGSMQAVVAKWKENLLLQIEFTDSFYGLVDKIVIKPEDRLFILNGIHHLDCLLHQLQRKINLEEPNRQFLPPPMTGHIPNTNANVHVQDTQVFSHIINGVQTTISESQYNVNSHYYANNVQNVNPESYMSNENHQRSLYAAQNVPRQTGYADFISDEKRNENIETNLMKTTGLSLSEKSSTTGYVQDDIQNPKLHEIKETNPFKMDILLSNKHSETYGSTRIIANNYNEMSQNMTDCTDHKSMNTQTQKVVYENGPIMYNVQRQHQEQNLIINDHVTDKSKQFNGYNKTETNLTDQLTARSCKKVFFPQANNLQNGYAYIGNDEINENSKFVDTSSKNNVNSNSFHFHPSRYTRENDPHLSNNEYFANCCNEKKETKSISADEWINSIENTLINLKFSEKESHLKVDMPIQADVTDNSQGPSPFDLVIKKYIDASSNHVRKNIEKYNIDLINERMNRTRQRQPKIIFFQEVASSQKVSHVFHFEEEGWISMDEFIDEFIGWKVANNVLKGLNAKINKQEINRGEYLRVLLQLDDTRLKAIRDHDGRINKIQLISLKSVIRILTEMKIITTEDVDAYENNKNAEDSVIHKLLILVEAYNGLKREIEDTFSIRN